MILAKCACSSIRRFIQKHPRMRIVVTRPMLPGFLLPLMIGFSSRQVVTMLRSYNGPSRRNSKTHTTFVLYIKNWLICYNYDLVKPCSTYHLFERSEPCSYYTRNRYQCFDCVSLSFRFLTFLVISVVLVLKVNFTKDYTLTRKNGNFSWLSNVWGNTRS